MLYAFIVSAVLLLAGILLLGLRIFFTKTGKFPNIHIGGSKALRDKGIGCATSQDRQAQQKIKRIKVSEMINEITENY